MIRVLVPRLLDVVILSPCAEVEAEDALPGLDQPLIVKIRGVPKYSTRRRPNMANDSARSFEHTVTCSSSTSPPPEFPLRLPRAGLENGTAS